MILAIQLALMAVAVASLFWCVARWEEWSEEYDGEARRQSQDTTDR